MEINNEEPAWLCEGEEYSLSIITNDDPGPANGIIMRDTHVGYHEFFTIEELSDLQIRIVAAMEFAAKSDVRWINDMRMERYLDHIHNRNGYARIHKKPKEKKKEGFVYIMKDESLGFIKIGYTRKDPKYREGTLQAEKPTITLIHQAECYSSTERELHQIFKEFRIRGEWFNVSPEVVIEKIKQLVA